jgi:hypothetical protein
MGFFRDVGSKEAVTVAEGNEIWPSWDHVAATRGKPRRRRRLNVR